MTEELHDVSFPVGERLKSKKLIGELFTKGSSFSFYPFRFIYLTSASVPMPGKPALLISIPRKRHRRATDRNLLKRRIREAYRHHKHRLHQKQIPIVLAIIYIGKEKMPQQDINSQMKDGLRRLTKKLPQTEDPHA